MTHDDENLQGSVVPVQEMLLMADLELVLTAEYDPAKSLYLQMMVRRLDLKPSRLTIVLHYGWE